MQGGLEGKISFNSSALRASDGNNEMRSTVHKKKNVPPLFYVLTFGPRLSLFLYSEAAAAPTALVRQN